jgi:hypothetical protein
MTMTMATQDTMSAWFWMTNSWLSTGKFLLADFLPLIGAIVRDELGDGAGKSVRAGAT